MFANVGEGKKSMVLEGEALEAFGEIMQIIKGGNEAVVSMDTRENESHIKISEKRYMRKIKVKYKQ